VPVIQFWVRKFAVPTAFVLIAACGGGGDGASSPVFGTQSKVFAADEVNGAVGSTENANPAPGSAVAITKIITGSNTQLPKTASCLSAGCLPSLALDSGRDQLYVSTNTSILVFNNAGTATGNVAPSRLLGNLGTGPNRYLALNTASDILYVSIPSGTILRLDGASTAGSITGASRTLTLTPFNIAGDTITDMALDATRDVLYVALSRGGAGRVGIVPNISQQTTTATITAEIAVSATTPSITIDGPRNVLYVSGLQLAQVLVFDSASTLLGPAPLPNRTIAMPAVATQYRLFVETTNDRLYAAAGNRVVILNGASTATTSVGAAVAQLSTINSGLTAVVARP
jgi:hypothetical protein